MIGRRAIAGRGAILIAGMALVIVIGRSTPARSDDPVTSAVRFNREIVRIFQRKCIACHAPDAISMSLATHRDARPWARAIREEIVEQRMPPWSAARGSVRFENDIGLTPRELTTILTWVDGGVPKGDDSDLPDSRTAAPPVDPATADRTIVLPPQSVPGAGADVVRRVTIDSGLTADRWVRQVRIRPGDRRLLRAAFAFIAPPGGGPPPAASPASAVWAAAWTPWQSAIAPPAGGAFLMRAGSRLTVELHYRGLDAAASDRSFVDLTFAADPPPAASTTIVLRAGRPRHSSGRSSVSERVLDAPVTLWALRPESLGDRQSLEVTARKPDGTVQVLLWIPRFRADWPAGFVLAQPIRLPRGTVLRATAGGPPGASGVRALLAVQG